MKLIDILVEELPKNGGWLRDVKTMAQDRGGDIWGYDCVSPCLKGGLWSSKSGEDLVRTSKIEVRNLAADWNTAIITREQYEAALAASKRCDHKWIPSEGRTQSGYLCSKCGNYDGPGYDWIDWPGGECPVPTGTLVDVRYRDGEEIFSLPADDLAPSSRDASFAFWRDSAQDNDIIAYRLHKPQEAELAEADDEADLNECIGQDAAPVWNGEGLPPVGCECEFISNDTSWGSVVVIGMDGDKVVIKPSGETYYGITPSEKQVFRPIRSEADKKRDEAVQALCNAGGGNGRVDEESGYGSCWFDVYDAIAAGKIPGVKMED